MNLWSKPYIIAHNVEFDEAILMDIDNIQDIDNDSYGHCSIEYKSSKGQVQKFRVRETPKEIIELINNSIAEFKKNK